MSATTHPLFHILDLDQDTDAWLEWRFSGIGASDASTVMGDNRFQSPEELLHQKRNRIRTETNAAMQLGKDLEPEARRQYIDFTGVEVDPMCLQSRDHDWMLASMDGMSPGLDRIVEIKCGRSAYAQAVRGVVPDYYYGQLQHQMMVTGLESVDYFCYWPGKVGKLQTVRRNADYIARLFVAEQEFMTYLRA